ncbi:MAG: outer membrane lipoprotein-sorting protein [Endomicrobia bacterium]|nr:outer membrane lipoprotein-sorting protein [Endomicrobiia bacterium]
MKKILKLSFTAIICVTLFFTAGFSQKPDEEKAQKLLEQAVLLPHQAFSDAKTLYVKSVQSVEMSQIKELLQQENLDNSSGIDFEKMFSESITGNKTEQEYWKDGNKFRISMYNKNAFMNMEIHFVFDGKTLTTISNTARKEQEEFTAEEAKAFASSAASGIFNFKDAFGETMKYEFLGTKKIGEYDCNVVQTAFVNENAQDNEQKEFLKIRYFIDKKTNVVVKTEIVDSVNVTSEVKKMKKIAGKSVPIIIESSVGNVGKGIMTYEIKVNDPINPAIFDSSKISVTMDEESEGQTQLMQQLTESIAGFMNAFSGTETDALEESMDSDLKK